MKRLNGFTLIELLIVVAIIAILAAIAVPNFLEAQVRSKVSRAMTDMRTEALALEAYSVDYNVAPVDSEWSPTNVNIFADFPYGTGAGTCSYWPGTRTGATVYNQPSSTFLNPGEAFVVNTGGYNTKMISWWEKALTTPISYISSQIKDVFHDQIWKKGNGNADTYGDPGYTNMCIGANFLYRNFEHVAKAYCKGNGTPDGVSTNQKPFDNPGNNSFPCYWIYTLGGYRWALFSAGPSYRGKRHQVDGINVGNAPVVGMPGLPTYDPTNGTKSWGYIIRTNKGVYTIGSNTNYTANSSNNTGNQFGIPN